MNYKKFLEYNIDLSPVGVMYMEDSSGYFCTPKNAQVIGWEGTDGIHYCFIDGFSDIVFAVSPMNLPGEYVHPVARNFTDFLRLILACGYAGTLEQAWAWDEAQFDGYVAEVFKDGEQNTLLAEMQTALNLTPMEHPFVYLKELHETFDYSRIPYTEEYYDLCEEDDLESESSLWEPPPWKVTFGDGFGTGASREHPGIEIPIQKHFDWDGQRVYVPSVYSCAKGLVVDICIEVSPRDISSFMEKWNLLQENDESDFIEDQRMLTEAENPLNIPFSTEVLMNGRMLRSHRGSGITWDPCLPERNDPQAKGILDYYSLDPENGWIIYRCSFPWKHSRRPQVKTLSLTLKGGSVAIPGTRFRELSVGECVAFIHPKTGQQHCLTVHECERRQMPMQDMADDSFEYPNHYMAMRYSIFPDLPREETSLVDRIRGDNPTKKKQNSQDMEMVNECMVIGIIGGSDGGTAIHIANQEQIELRLAYSSLHFDDQFEVAWELIFREKRRSDVTLDLILPI